MPTEIDGDGYKRCEKIGGNDNCLKLVEEFEDDIFKNLKSWCVRGRSIFYLTKKNWYQIRSYNKKMSYIRHNLKSHKLDRVLNIVSNTLVGKKFLSDHGEKRTVDNFFKFIADIQRR